MPLFHKWLYYSTLLLAPSFMARAQGPSPQLWFMDGVYTSSPSAVQASEALINTAIAAGYTGVVFSDSSYEFLSLPSGPPSNAQYMQEVLNYARSKGLQTQVPTPPFGYSNDMLVFDPSWAEAQRVVGAQFEVNSSRTQLQFLNSFPGLQNAGFESGQVDWFSMGDAGVGISTSVAHSGNASAVISNAPANGRLVQQVTLKTWRQYHLQLFYKSQNFSGYTAVEFMDGATGAIRSYTSFNAGGTQDWTEVDYTFDSQTMTNATIYLGEW